MIDIKLYTKISNLPARQQAQVVDFINSLKKEPAPAAQNIKRLGGKAKGLIVMKENFDDEIEGFNAYTK